MRSLTSSEVEVTRVLLARIPGGDRELIRRSGVPRTTLQRVRRTALREGWLHRAEIPALAPAGIGRVDVVLVQPFAEFHPAAAVEWARRPEVAVLLDLGESFLAVSFHADGSRPGTTPSVVAPSEGDWYRSAHRVRVSAEAGGFPVFFDFEGMWSRGVLGQDPISYPRGLTFDPSAVAGSPPAGAGRAFSDYLAARVGSARRVLPPWARLREHRWHRWFVEAGWLEPRIFLVPSSIPRLDVLPRPQLVFVLGNMREGIPPLSTFSRLKAEGGVHPFLYAEDGERAILGAFASGAPQEARPNSVLATLAHSLRNIEIVRAPLERVRMLTAFRIGAPARS